MSVHPPNTGPGGSSGLRDDLPTPARIYDYLLEGKDNYAVDREAAEAVEQREPNSRMIVRENREFLRRVVRYLVAEAGIRQIIDLGSGLPTQDNVHEIAQSIAPECRVVYVDNDPMVLVHGEALLADNERTAVVTADLRDAEDVLEAPATRELIDFTQPWALLSIAVFHFIPEDPRSIVAGFRQRMPAGSYLALSHLSQDATTPEVADHVVSVYANATAPMVLRRHDEIADIFAGFSLVDPGLPLIMDWRPDILPADPQRVWLYGAVGHSSP